MARCNHFGYTLKVKDDTERVVKVRLYIDGRVIEFDLPGPLVALPAKSLKGKGGKA